MEALFVKNPTSYDYECGNRCMVTSVNGTLCRVLYFTHLEPCCCVCCLQFSEASHIMNEGSHL